jgi:hypothetical protein
MVGGCERKSRPWYHPQIANILFTRDRYGLAISTSGDGRQSLTSSGSNLNSQPSNLGQRQVNGLRSRRQRVRWGIRDQETIEAIVREVSYLNFKLSELSAVSSSTGLAPLLQASIPVSPSDEIPAAPVPIYNDQTSQLVVVTEQVQDDSEGIADQHTTSPERSTTPSPIVETTDPDQNDHDAEGTGPAPKPSLERTEHDSEEIVEGHSPTPERAITESPASETMLSEQAEHDPHELAVRSTSMLARPTTPSLASDATFSDHWERDSRETANRYATALARPTMPWSEFNMSDEEAADDHSHSRLPLWRRFANSCAREMLRSPLIIVLGTGTLIIGGLQLGKT